MKTLLTGATGFLGSAVLRLLVDDGQDVRVLARANGARRNISGVKCEVVEGDLNDPDHSRQRRTAAMRYIMWRQIIVSGRPTLPNSIGRTTKAQWPCSVLPLRQVLPRMIYTSSVATLGIHSDGTPSNEDTPVSRSDMVGHYKRSKFDAESVKKLIRDDQLPIVIVNPSTPIGPAT